MLFGACAAKGKKMWNSRGLRGSAFEEMITLTNQLYMQHGLAVVQKVPTPITPIAVNNQAREITRAYFGEKSTVDFLGVAQGLALCFDAKETQNKNLPIRNIHAHQLAFMAAFEQQRGVSFLLVHFKLYGEVFFLPFAQLQRFYEVAQGGGRKSIPYDAFDPALRVANNGGFPVHYLEAINVWLAKN